MTLPEIHHFLFSFFTTHRTQETFRKSLICDSKIGFPGIKLAFVSYGQYVFKVIVYFGKLFNISQI